MNETIVYEKGGLKRPYYNYLQRKVLALNKISLIRNIGFIKRSIFRLYQLPPTASISREFHASAPLLKIGRQVGLSDTFIIAYAPITIGDNCSFSFRNIIITSSHDLSDFSTVIAKPVTIGRNVWITTNVTILPGVTIGDNTVIGAGSVVTHDIPPGVFAAGNPCKPIRNIDFKK